MIPYTFSPVGVQAAQAPGFSGAAGRFACDERADAHLRDMQAGRSRFTGHQD
jgi:hypothetical protein